MNPDVIEAGDDVGTDEDDPGQRTGRRLIILVEDAELSRLHEWLRRIHEHVQCHDYSPLDD